MHKELRNKLALFELIISNEGRELNGFDLKNRRQCYSIGNNLESAFELLSKEWDENMTMNKAILLIGGMCPMNSFNI